MANRKNEFQRFWNNTTKSLKNTTKLTARADFLKQCQKSKIIPPTLKTNAPKNNPNRNYPKNSNRFKNVAENASKQNLQIAANDAKRTAEQAKKYHQSYLDDRMKNFTSHQSEYIKNEFSKLEKNMLKQHNLKYLAKIQHLKLKHHMNTVHKGRKAYKCDSCGKSFSQNLHEDYKYYKCDSCGESFSHSSILKKCKNNVHESYKDYKCELCGKSFSESEPRVPGFTKKPSKSRRFIKKNKYKKWKRKEAMKKPLDLVHNLSDLQLSEPMKSLLNRGLGFVPTPKTINITETLADLDKYNRRMRWREFFFEKETEEDPDLPLNIFRHDKTNLPKTKSPNALQTYLGATKSDILGSCRRPNSCKDNLTASERSAIKELAQLQSTGQIQIKPADKGGGVVIMNSSDYLNELSKQLSAIFTNKDSTTSPFYEKTEPKALEDQKKTIEKAIQKGFELDIISKSDKEFMMPSGKPNRLYGLPKMHKIVHESSKDHTCDSCGKSSHPTGGSKNRINTVHEGHKENKCDFCGKLFSDNKFVHEGKKFPPCRPIVSNSGSNTENISGFVDFYSRHLVKNLKSYVEDSPDLLRIIENENKNGPQTKNTFPVTIDVTALYTSIPTNGVNGGIQAFEKALNSRTNEEKSKVPTSYLLELLDLVLNGNIFEFNGKHYIQKIGTAMGTKVAPTYACLFMGWLEETFLEEIWKGQMPHLWRRFIDDIFFLWHGSVKELEEFISALNQQHPHIKYTANYNPETKSVPFLDMEISIDKNGYIKTDLYKKDTAKCQYLLPSSCHPHHIPNNIPFSLSYRLLRICSDPLDFEKRLEELRQDLLKRNYHPKIIQNSFQKIKKIKRTDALKKVFKTKTIQTPLITTYHPALPTISTIVKKHHKVMIDEDPRLKRCFPIPSVIAYKRSKNLKDMLVKSKFQSSRNLHRKSNGFNRCGENFSGSCKACENIPKWGIKHHTCHKTKNKFTINSQISCVTKNVIYKLSCTKCIDWVYIGETGRRFRDRFQEHRGYVSQKNLSQPTGEHFNKPGHTVDNILPTIIERVFPIDNKALRLRRESYWIKKYQSVEFGANKKC